MANAILRVLRLLLSWAQDRGIVKDNAASRPKALRVDPRRQVWDSTAEAQFMAVADAPMRLAFLPRTWPAKPISSRSAGINT